MNTAPRRRDVVSAQQDLKQRGIGLDQALVARHRDVPEQAQERETLLRDRVHLRREIGDRVQRHVRRREAFEQRHRARDGAGHHFVVAVAERVDQRGVLGMLRLSSSRVSANCFPASCCRCHSGVQTCAEEMLHRLFVVEQLAKEVARIPVDQDAAEIEDDGVAHHSRITGAAMLSIITLMQAGLPLASARSIAPGRSAALSTYSPWPPSAATTRS